MMVHKADDAFYKLTFAQREGKSPLPESMQTDSIPDDFRRRVWRCIQEAINSTYDEDPIDGYTDWDLGSILFLYQFEILGKWHDEIESHTYQGDIRFCHEQIRNGEYHEVLTFIEFILRHDKCSERLGQYLMDAFDKSPIAYFVANIDNVPTIVPRASQEQGEATKRAIETLREGGMEGAATHLRQAAVRFKAQQYADSVESSIEAVESVARKIAPKSKTLGEALKNLENKGLLTNRQLKTGFEKIYAYTNAEEGVRHSLVFKDSSDVGLDEAVFMFGACASFAAYLVNKHHQMQKAVGRVS